MNPSLHMLVVVACLSVTSHDVHAVTCAANLSPSNPDTAYTNLGDGTVTHVPTGLIWKRCSEGQSWTGSTCTGTASTSTWAQALTLARTSSFAGQTDWRLPNIKELRSLMEECRSGPSINDTIFPATLSWIYWSGSPYPDASSHAGYVDFGLGSAGFSYMSNTSFHVRLVRGGQSFDNLGVAGNPAAVKFASESLPDGTYQVGAASKTWSFKNGATAIAGLKAVPVSGKTDTGLGITATQVTVGDVAANAEFTVSLPVVPAHAGAAVKASYWKLVDGSGADVKISNSKTGQFWLRLRTNLAPAFSPLQLDSVSAKLGQTVSLPILARDGDGDALTITASSGSVSNGVWSGSFTSAGVQPITVTVSDGIESATKTIYTPSTTISSMLRWRG